MICKVESRAEGQTCVRQIMGVDAQRSPVDGEHRWLKVLRGDQHPFVIEVWRCCSLRSHFHTHFPPGKHTKQIPRCSVVYFHFQSFGISGCCSQLPTENIFKASS